MAERDPRNPSDPPRFLSIGALQDPTLRTPGSEIPESLYATSDAEPFDIRSLPSAPVPSPRPSLNRVTLLLLLLTLAILAAMVFLYSHRSAPQPSPSSSTSRLLFDKPVPARLHPAPQLGIHRKAPSGSTLTAQAVHNIASKT